MAVIRFDGIDDYISQLQKLNTNTNEIIGKAIYAGAGVMADAIKQNIRALPVVTGYGTTEKPLPGGVTSVQKSGLIDGFGISHLQETQGYLNVKLGFDGYNRTKTEKYPKGQPNQLVARGVESGTSWKKKKPFIRPAISKSRKQVEETMKSTIDEEINKIMK